MAPENLVLNDLHPINVLFEDYEKSVWKYRFNNNFERKFEKLLLKNINNLKNIKRKTPEGFHTILDTNLEFLNSRKLKLEEHITKKESIVTWFIFGLTGKGNILPQIRETHVEYQKLKFNDLTIKAKKNDLNIPIKELSIVAYYLLFNPTENMLEYNKNVRKYTRLTEIIFSNDLNFNSLRTNYSKVAAGNFTKIAKATHEFFLNEGFDLGIPYYEPSEI